MTAYDRPTTLAEALDIRARGPVVVLAGGTDVYPARATRAGWGDMGHDPVLDISAIEELRGIDRTADGFRFGALTTWSDLKAAELPPAFAGYQAAAREIGGVQVQNRGTLVGNICTASPAGDGIPCLLSLDAAVEVASVRGRRRVPIADFVDGYRHVALAPDEIVTAILVPAPRPGARGGFVKLGARRYLVISIAMVAGVVATDDQDHIVEASLAVGACSAVARRLETLEADLRGVPLASASDRVRAAHCAALAPIDDIRATARYRAAVAVDLVRDLLATLAGETARRVA